MRDMGVMKESLYGFLAMGLTGAFTGFVPLAVLMKRLKKVSLRQAFTVTGLLVFIGAFKFATGGVGELEKGDFLIGIST